MGLIIRKTENVQDKVIGIGHGSRDQLEPDVVRDLLSKVIQNNVRFCLCIWTLSGNQLVMSERLKRLKCGH